MSIVAPSGSPEIVSSITSFTAWGILSLATLGYYGVKAVYDPVKNLYGESSTKSTEPSLFKSFCSYTAYVLKDSIYKQTIKPILNEAWKFLLVDAITEDVKGTAKKHKSRIRLLI